MTANFYKIDCPRSVIDKSGHYAASSLNVSISPYEPIDDISGYIITSGTYDSYNYVSINNLNGRTRYYFVGPREVMTGGRCRIRLDEDVLMTWKDTIMNTPCVVGRAGLGGMKDMGNDIPLMSYSIISDNAQQTSALSSDLSYGTANDLYYVLFTASAGNTAAASEENSGLLPDVNKGAGIEPAQNVTEFGKKW